MEVFQRLVWQQINGERDNGFWKGRFMPDKFDYATELSELEREEALKSIGNVVLPGRPYCLRCDEVNDRARDGYAICSDCFEALNGQKR